MMTLVALFAISTGAWAQTENGAKNQNRPRSILLALTGEGAPKKDGGNVKGYCTGADFEAARARIVKEVKENVD